MELVSQASANLSREKFVAYPKFFTAPDHHKSVFPRFAVKPLPLSEFHFQARTTRSRTQNSVLLGNKRQVWVSEQEHGVQEEEEEGSSDSDDGSSFLSLSEKPDRNTALLDDYEIEELDLASDPNHRSG